MRQVGIKVASVIAFVSTVYLSGMLAFWTVDREPPAQVLDVKVETPVVAQGGELVVTRQILRTRQCPTSVDRWFVDAQGIRYVLEDQSFAVFGPLGLDTYTIGVSTPPQISKGPARYYTAVSYFCNPLQRIWPIEFASPVVKFEVK